MSQQLVTALDRVEQHTSTRGAFLRKAGIGAALAGGGVLLARPGVGLAGHDDRIPDVDILNYALTLEYLEASFYTQALGGAGTTGVPTSSAAFGRGDITGSSIFDGFGGRIRNSAYGYLTDIRDHEVVHVEFLRSALGSAAVRPCTFDFSSALASVEAFIDTAQVLENTGVMAYDGAIRTSTPAMSCRRAHRSPRWRHATPPTST